MFDYTLDEPIIFAAYRSFTVQVPNPPTDLTRTYIQYQFSFDNSNFSEWIDLADLDSTSTTFTHSDLGMYNEYARHSNLTLPFPVYSDPIANSFFNPSFTADVSNWTMDYAGSDSSASLTRDTAHYTSAPAALHYSTGTSANPPLGTQLFHGDINGLTFQKNVTYSVSAQVGAYTVVNGTTTGQLAYYFGTSTDNVRLINVIHNNPSNISFGVAKYPSTSQQVGIHAVWSNIGNALAQEDGIFSTVAVPSNDTSNLLTLTGFDFSGIPDSTVVNGITVTIKWKTTIDSNGQGCSVFTVQLIKNGSSSGFNRSDGTQLPSTLGYRSFGNAADLWGLTWTIADFKSNFGVGIQVAGPSIAGGTDTASIDSVQITLNVPFLMNNVTANWTPKATVPTSSVNLNCKVYQISQSDSNLGDVYVDDVLLTGAPSPDPKTVGNIYSTYDPATIAAINLTPVFYRYRYRLVTASGDSDWSEAGYAGQVRTITTAEVESGAIGYDQLTQALKDLLGI